MENRPGQLKINASTTRWTFHNSYKYLIKVKHFITVITLFISTGTFSQTSIETELYGAASLNQYLWSFSKNSPKPGEKALVDFDVMDNRRGLGNYLSVSENGRYFAYTINKMVYNDFKFGLYKLDSLVIQSTKDGLRTVLPSIDPGFFTADSRQYIFLDKSTLCFLQLGSTQIRKRNDVASYKISQNKWLAYQLKGKDSLNLQNLITGKEKQFASIADHNFSSNGEWLICKNNGKELLLYSVATGTEKRFSDVLDYTFSENGKSLVIKTATALQYINLPQGDAKSIWTIKDKTAIGNYSIDASGKQVVFTILDNADAIHNTIGYYKQGLDKAVLKISNQTLGIRTGMIIKDASFTDNGHYLNILLQTKTEEPGKPNTDLAGLEVWNHKDLSLQSAQSKGKATRCIAIADIETGKLIFLESKDKKLMQMRGDFVLVKKDNREAHGDRFWEKVNDSLWVISLKEGERNLLPTKSQRFWFSPLGDFLVYFDNNKGCKYYGYDLNTGVIKDISANVPQNGLGFGDESEGNLAAWIENETSVLVYDNYDIWKLDLTGKQPAVNITNGLGRASSTILNLFSTDHYSGEIPTVKANESLVLRGYNTANKQSGFYKKDGIKAAAPAALYMGNYFMNEIAGVHDGNVVNAGMAMAPVKAKTANSWVVQRQSTNDAPNYYETSDFKSFSRLSNYQPQNGYQWYTEELHSFKHLDGKEAQGILFKPENFDPAKKYPVVIAFYGGFSNNMYQFHAPSYIDQAMEAGKSPLWFLNNGYLVFTPDIAVAPLKYGPKAFSVIEGAAQYLKQLPYVNANKLGCGSHSWSAKLGAYIFTHSKSISATAITEGFLYGNMVNVALSTNASGVSKLVEVENGFQFGNLWEHKNLWLDQTTVLKVDKAISPLLLLCNKESNPEYQDQTLQFFTALRRLDKNVWWLKYDKGGHTLTDQKELKDYTVRYTQFFDHYLKNAPAPQWMTQGVPYKLKGIESRYELDPQGTCNSTNGDPCPICEAWNAQYRKTPAMFQKEIKEWVLDKDIADDLERKQNEKRKQLDIEGEVQTKEVMRMLNKK
jgi:hypothetical protein